MLEHAAHTLYPSQWLQYEFTQPYTLTGYSVATEDGECPGAWTFEAYHDGAWEVLDTQSGQQCHQGTFEEYSVSSEYAYSKYRWSFTQGVGGNSNGGPT